MYTIEKVKSTIKPTSPFIYIGPNRYVYVFNIKEEDGAYEYSTVNIRSISEFSTIYEAVLKKYYNENMRSLYEVLASPIIDDEALQTSHELNDMIKIDLGLKARLTDLEIAKIKKLEEIDSYDCSKEVNSFYLNGVQVWLDKATRVGLMNSLTIEKECGKQISTLWFENTKLDINTDAAIQMLSALELYALECYNKTAEHKVAVQALESIEEVENYDYTVGYPDKLNLTTN